MLNLNAFAGLTGMQYDTIIMNVCVPSQVRQINKTTINFNINLNKQKTMNYPIGKRVIVRTNRAGVFFATLSEFDAQTRIAELKDCRRIHYWEGACSLSQLAEEGPKKPDSCRFSMYVPVMQVMETIEIIPCSDKAIKIIEGVKIWKM